MLHEEGGQPGVAQVEAGTNPCDNSSTCRRSRRSTHLQDSACSRCVPPSQLRCRKLLEARVCGSAQHRSVSNHLLPAAKPDGKQQKVSVTVQSQAPDN